MAIKRSKLTTGNKDLDLYIESKVHDIRFDLGRQIGDVPMFNNDDMEALYSCKDAASVDKFLRDHVYELFGLED